VSSSNLVVSYGPLHLASCAANTASNYSIAGGLHALGIGNNGGIGGFLTTLLEGTRTAESAI
jgi:hypothetical protein